ncbi:MAG: chromosomal replication initiator protein DnaA [Candidatus Sumerlaeota bacterium]|nr:chromosomal replication initiator protein DnaA [Candidatus Sumerlaeota bacterium]
MTSAVANVWDRALLVLQDRVDEESFRAWLQPTEFYSFDDSTLVIGVPSPASRNWLASHFMDTISSAVTDVVEHPVDIAFVVVEKLQAESSVSLENEAAGGAREAYRASRLNAQYTFDAFVVGESNRFAHAAARAVAEPGAKTYNPLFIYGGVGLGKTHLMQAIGHEHLSADRSSNVLYVTSEQFMNAFVDSVARGGSSSQFRTFYRNVDLLLIDDVQFFMGKEATQVEFFHTFNALYDSGRKIVVSSDRAPKELNRLDERLRSRFEWGLIVDIQPPDLETRMAILRAKAQMHGIDLPYEVAIYIAERIKTNVRKLEGVVLQIKARWAFNRSVVTKEEARGFLTPFMVGEEPKKISPESITRVVCEYFDVDYEDLRGKSRLRKHALPRHVAMYLCRGVASLSYPEIGQYYGARDHSSVMHACRKIEARIDKEMNVQNLVTYLTKKIQESAGA